MVGHDTGNIRTYVNCCWLSVVVVFALWLALHHYCPLWSWLPRCGPASWLSLSWCCVGMLSWR